MTMTNPNKPITKQDLNDYHNKILPYLGGMPEVLANKFAKGDLYDTNEKIIGKWIDGKPLYQRVYHYTNISKSSSTYSLETLPNTYEVIDINILVKHSSNSVSRVPYYQSEQFNMWGDVDGGVIRYFNNWDTFSDVYCILLYTKSTDSANSFNIGEATDYSTDEKIVGTWIDGSYLYQLTINLGAITTDNYEKDVSSLNIDKLVNASGYILRTGTYITIPCVYTNLVNNQIQCLDWIRYDISSKKLKFSNYKINETTECVITIQYTKTS